MSQQSDQLFELITFGYGLKDTTMYVTYALILSAVTLAHVTGYSMLSYTLLAFLVGSIYGRITAVYSEG